MILKESQTDPQVVSVNGSLPQNMYQKLVTHKITDDEDMMDLHAEMTNGRDIILNVRGKEATYIMTREFVPSKIALPGANGK